jgi:hypothetical protein
LILFRVEAAGGQNFFPLAPFPSDPRRCSRSAKPAYQRAAIADFRLFPMVPVAGLEPARLFKAPGF